MTQTVASRNAGPQLRPIDDLLRTADLLWPSSHRVVYSTSPPAPRRHQGHIVLPGPQAPRLCVPADNRRAAVQAMLRFSAALPAHQVVARLASAAAVALQARPALRHRLVVTGQRDCGLGAYLSSVFGTQVSMSFGIGSARANRKPVLGLFDARGHCLGYAKLGVDPFTDEQVTREERALRCLREVEVPRVLTPRVVHFAMWGQHPLLVLSALQPGPWATVRRRGRTPARQMEAFGEAFSPRERPLADSQWWHTTVRSVDRLDGDQRTARLQRCFRQIEGRWGDTRVRLGAWHGDWTPWNMGWSRGRLMLWDFERFEVGAPIGLDAVHYAVNTAAGTGTEEERITRALGTGGRAGDPADAVLLGAAYLSSITARYLVAARSANGQLIDNRAAMMLRILERWLDETEQGRFPS